MVSMVEHIPWIGDGYQKGIDGQRYAICGYSHWFEEGEPDSSDATIADVRQYIAGAPMPSFFIEIAKYFSRNDHRAFWDKVLFFNYIPSSIGGPSDRYNQATDEQVDAAKSRLTRILADHQPHKLLVFSKKAWQSFPKTREELSGHACAPLGDFSGFTWGTYEADGRVTMAFGLRHPLGASADQMRSAVNFIRLQPAAVR